MSTPRIDLRFLEILNIFWKIVTSIRVCHQKPCMITVSKKEVVGVPNQQLSFARRENGLKALADGDAR
jgi:hypothetical protein